jgi:hypothetical protein
VFSKTELEYLRGKYVPSNNHKRFLNHKIRKKLKEFYQSELPLIENSCVSEFANNVSEFSNNNKIAEGMRSPIYEGKRSLERGTNPRPNAYEAFALPG